MNGWWRRVAEKLNLCCLLFVVLPRCEAQNLVPNGSFELTDTCPYTISFQEGDQPLYWRTWLNNPDYFNACADTSDELATLVSVPQNAWAFQYAQDGDAYVGFYAYYADQQYREYVGTPLTAPLTVGETYYMSLWVNMADSGNYYALNFGACNNMGLLFTMHSNAWTDFNGPGFPFRNYAHLYRQEVLTDTANWTLVSGSFVADSAYQYLVLGNFFDNAHTDVLPLPPGNGEYSYCFVDNVCVSPNPNGCDVTGIDEIQWQDLPTAFVDGAAGNLVVTWPGHARYTGEVVDMTGRRICNAETSGGQLRLSIAGLSAGMYVTRLREGGERAFVKFVIPR
jgi:hypothetical protein